jgi:glycosyltransferase involved in cell wall biosynthesis
VVDIGRLFVVDPGLVNSAGHPIQYAVTLKEHCTKVGLPLTILCRDRASQKLLHAIEDSLPILHHHCFPVTKEAEHAFYGSLSVLDERVQLASTDLILITSAYINELEGVAEFVKERSQHDRPLFAFNFHQLVPPSTDAGAELSAKYVSEWTTRLRKVFRQRILESPIVSLWTTDSEGLNKEISQLTNSWVGRLPFLFMQQERKISTIDTVSTRIGFLGDGRAEKGMLVLLRAVNKWFPADSQVSFIIQNIGVRGYPSDDLEEVEALIGDMRHRQNVSFIDTDLDSNEFSETLASLDVAVFPYDPLHYSNRASMLFVQAVAAGLPVIVSDGTWMAGKVKTAEAVGSVIEFKRRDVTGNASRLTDAIWKMVGAAPSLTDAACIAASAVRQTHSPQRYLQTIFDRYATLR